MIDFKASICSMAVVWQNNALNEKIMSINLVVGLINIQTCDCIDIGTNSIFFTGEI